MGGHVRCATVVLGRGGVCGGGGRVVSFFRRVVVGSSRGGERPTGCEPPGEFRSTRAHVLHQLFVFASVGPRAV